MTKIPRLGVDFLGSPIPPFLETNPSLFGDPMTDCMYWGEQAKQTALKSRTSKLMMGPGQESDDIKAIQVSNLSHSLPSPLIDRLASRSV